MNRALVGTLESAPPGTSAAQLRERLRAPVVLEQLRRADPECAAAVEHQDADAFVEYLLRAQEPPEGGDVALEPEELYTGDPDPEEAGLGGAASRRCAEGRRAAASSAARDRKGFFHLD